MATTLKATKLDDQVPVSIVKPGRFAYQVSMTSGTAEIQFKVDDSLPFEVIDGATFSVATNGEIALPKCSVQAVLTGDATVFIERIE